MRLPFTRFLVVCTGNICRSPMGEAYLRDRLGAGGEFLIGSAGTGALVGYPADDHAITAMQEKGLDISAHRAQQLTLALARNYDLLLVMDDGHREWIEKNHPVLRGRLYRFGHWLDAEVVDPVGQPLEAFREARDLIERSADAWAQRLLSH
ncbi:low molecular weight protein-tyrosine-phosphatase [Alkalilimnicola ehrlichii MLHE-1]|uniref:protein-tyrosine-phosphatase n=1 Tax=Alkalilimnicola ehrlichii (strain ATCC BAA-1101 / DSM 17681 / MLHE-1) TaxID=187272 RepID=Q0AAI5_ALKEH|nr:low molecular weight protein-tyrosine-phosphatase [Alkalilimnicola ehrlichii]ABI56152.1 protein tyrosine phosphatase [Alkalilimnicola ehrlichii MLHE-1]